jgi:hypothetical protein
MRAIRVRGTHRELNSWKEPLTPPSQSELCSSRPRKRGAREKNTDYSVTGWSEMSQSLPLKIEM